MAAAGHEHALRHPCVSVLVLTAAFPMLVTVLTAIEGRGVRSHSHAQIVGRPNTLLNSPEG